MHRKLGDVLLGTMYHGDALSPLLLEEGSYKFICSVLKKGDNCSKQ